MGIYEAVGIIEGFEECEGEEQYIEAFQVLIDDGCVWQLQGRFGREAKALLDQGICTLPQKEEG